MSSIPTTQKAVQIEKTGGVEVLHYRDLPVPTPAEGEVLIKNNFIGINYIDTYFRSGLYPAPKPEILGREAEGTIVSLASSGEFHNLKVGDRVVFLHVNSYAEYTSVPASKVQVVPSSIGPGIAAAALLQGLTAITLIREAHYVEKGDWVLVHAAAGGVGLWLVQLLRTVGAKVIGTSSTKEKLALAHENGADWTVNYKQEDIVARVKEITGGEGVRVVFDSIGKDQFENDLEVVARKGTVVSFGNASGPVPPLTISRLSAKNARLLRPTLFNYIATREEFDKYTKELRGNLNFIPLRDSDEGLNHISGSDNEQEQSPIMSYDLNIAQKETIHMDSGMSWIRLGTVTPAYEFAQSRSLSLAVERERRNEAMIIKSESLSPSS
ncbi:hypothetical protein V499_03537, partial [Pseudogymnoascus sp. VKM F-103]